MSQHSVEETLLAGLEFPLPSIDALVAAAASRKRNRLGERALCSEGMLLQKLSPCPPLLPSDDGVVNAIAASVAAAFSRDEQKNSLVDDKPKQGTEKHASTNGKGAPSTQQERAAASGPTTPHEAAMATLSPSASASASTKFDYNRCLDAIRSNAKKPLASCKSALSAAQHRHYTPFVLSALLHGVASIEKLAERDALLDIVDREQTAYLAKWMQYVLSASEGTAPHVCMNQNYMPLLLEPFAQQFVARRAASLRENAAAGGAPSPRGDASVQLPLGTLPPQPPRAGRLVSSSLLRSAQVPAGGGAPTAVTRCPTLHPLDVEGAAVSSHRQVATTEPAAGGIVIPFDVLVSIATATSLPEALPLRVAFRVHPGGGGEHPLVRFATDPCSAVVRRRAVLEAAFACAVDRDSALSLAQRNEYAALLQIPRAAADAPLTVASTVFAEDITERILIRMIKLQYSCKAGAPPNTDGGDEATTAFEEFSREELIAMHLALVLHPQAHVVVFHVNPYTSTLLAVETFTPTTFSSMLWTPKDAACTMAWSRAVQVINALSAHVASMQRDGLHLPFSGVLECAPPSKQSSGGGGSSEGEGAAAATVAVLLGAEDRLAGDVALEPVSEAVAKREYLGPSVWPHADRIPFTFPPADAVATTSHPSTMMRSKLAGKDLLVKRTLTGRK